MNTAVRPMEDTTRGRRLSARIARRSAAAALAVGLALTLAPPAAGLAEARISVLPETIGWCGISWGSLPKTSTSTAMPGTVIGVRAGRHACFDRLVIDVRGRVAGHDVRYVDAVRTDGAGTLVPLSGGADLQIVVRAPAYDSNGRATYRPTNPARLVDVTGWSTFRQVAWAGSFEGSTTIGLGVRARLPMRVFVLPGTDVSRVVIDVAHRW